MSKIKLVLINNIIILLILLCISFVALGEIDKEMLLNDERRKPPDNFYIQKSDDIYKADTVTYYITKSRPRNDLINIFRDYSKLIGDTNGAVIIDIKDKLIMDSNDNEYFKYLINIGCDIPKNDEELPVLIFEDKRRKKCFTFKSVNDDGFDATLIKLFNTRNESQKMGRLELNSELQLIVKNAINSFPKLKDNIIVFRDVIDFITK